MSFCNINKIQGEYDGLYDRFQELSNFMESKEYEALPCKYQAALDRQKYAMEAYLYALEYRLELIANEP